MNACQPRRASPACISRRSDRSKRLQQIKGISSETRSCVSAVKNGAPLPDRRLRMQVLGMCAAVGPADSAGLGAAGVQLGCRSE